MSEPSVRASDQVLVVGKNGSGKSYLLRYLFKMVRSQAVVVNVKRDPDVSRFAAALDESGAGLVDGNPAQLQGAMQRHRIVEYIPANPLDVDETDAVYRILAARSDVTVWLDEAAGPTTSNRVAPGMVRFLQHGRFKRLRHFAATQRPVNIARPLMTEAHHVVFFPRGFAAADIAVIAAEFGVTRKELEHLAGKLRGEKWGEYAHLWYDRRANIIYLRPSIPAGWVS